MLLVELEQGGVHERVQPVEARLDEVELVRVRVRGGLGLRLANLNPHPHPHPHPSPNLVPVRAHLQAVELLHVVHHEACHA